MEPSSPFWERRSRESDSYYYMKRNQCKEVRLFPQAQYYEVEAGNFNEKLLCESRYRPSPQKNKICNVFKSSMSGTSLVVQ